MKNISINIPLRSVNLRSVATEKYIPSIYLEYFPISIIHFVSNINWNDPRCVNIIIEAKPLLGVDSDFAKLLKKIKHSSACAKAIRPHLGNPVLWGSEYLLIFISCVCLADSSTLQWHRGDEPWPMCSPGRCLISACSMSRSITTRWDFSFALITPSISKLI